MPPPPDPAPPSPFEWGRRERVRELLGNSFDLCFEDGVSYYREPSPEAAWTYYRELLLPDAERRQWMDDRRMVQILSEQGDRLATPRRVDHRLSFPDTPSRDTFITAVNRLSA